MAKDVGGLPYVGLALCYEELTIGRRFRTIGRTVTEADIVSVINRTGMAEVLFIRESDIKCRVAPARSVTPSPMRRRSSATWALRW